MGKCGTGTGVVFKPSGWDAMSEFEKGVYADMESVDRVILYAIKALELIEFARLMTAEDIRLLKRLVEEMRGTP